MAGIVFCPTFTVIRYEIYVRRPGSHAARAEPSGAAVLANGKCDSTLEDVMTLWPGCTPEELYCRKQRRCVRCSPGQHGNVALHDAAD